MSFHTTGLPQSDLAELVLKTILKVPECTGTNQYGCVTGILQHDLLFALFVPHVILLLYLYLISRGTYIFRDNKALGTLFGLAVYITLVYTGWYGILASWLIWWLAITVVFSFGYFFLTKIFAPAETGARYALGREWGRRSEERREERTEREREVRDRERRRRQAQRLRRRLAEVTRERDRVEADIARITDPHMRRARAERLRTLNARIAELNARIDELEIEGT